MIWGIAGILILGLLWFLLYTPYPFILFLRSKKEEPREKGRADQKQIEQGLIIRKGITYPSKYPLATYDLYYEQGKQPQRVLVWIHGGSFISGSSIGTKNYGPMMAKEGTLFCAINYTLAPRHHFPAQILQIDEFLHHLPDIVSKEGLQMPAALYLGGDSAGANLAAAYACMATTKDLATKCKIRLQAKQTISGLLLYCGPYDFTEQLDQPEFKAFRTMFKYVGWAYLGRKHWQKYEEKTLASPYLQVSESFPATYLCDGKKYSFLWQGKKLKEKLSGLQVFVKSRFYEEMPHEFQFDYVKYPKEAMQVFEDSCAFMKDVERKLV